MTKRYLILSDSFTDEDVEYSEDAGEEEEEETEEVDEEKEEIETKTANETLPQNVTERYSSLSLSIDKVTIPSNEFFSVNWLTLYKS